MELKVGISNRHIHLSEADFKKLFDSENLTLKANLKQDGQFASNETLTIKTEKNIINNVRIIGPFRDKTQVELSKTDAFFLGLNPPIRLSGDLDNSESITLVNGDKEAHIENCVILAARHIHIDEETLKDMDFKIGDMVSVKINNERGGSFDNVCIRPGNFELHIDTDEANAMNLKNNDIVEVIK